MLVGKDEPIKQVHAPLEKKQEDTKALTQIAPIGIPRIAELPAIRLPSAEDLKGEEKMRKDKFFAASMQKVQRRMVQRNYGYLFEEMEGLDNNTRASLKDALLERELALNDARSAAATLGISPSSDAYASVVSQVKTTAEQAIQVLLGDKYADFQRLDKLSGSMQFIDNITSVNMSYEQAPLTKEQRKELAEVMTELHYSIGDPQYPQLVRVPVNPQTGLNPLNEQLIAKASAFLTAKQISVLKAYQEEQTLALQYGAPAPPIR